MLPFNFNMKDIRTRITDQLDTLYLVQQNQNVLVVNFEDQWYLPSFGNKLYE